MPILKIHMDRIMENVDRIKEINKSGNDSEIMIITKVLMSNLEFVSKLSKKDIKSIGDTRLSNLQLLEEIEMRKMLMTMTMSEVGVQLEKIDIIY